MHGLMMKILMSHLSARIFGTDMTRPGKMSYTAGEAQRADAAGRSFRVHPPPPLLQHAEEEGQKQPKENSEAEEPRRSAAQAAAGQPLRRAASAGRKLSKKSK